MKGNFCALTVGIMTIVLSHPLLAASTTDDCGRSESQYIDSRSGSEPFGGRTIEYESVVQNSRRGTGKEYIYCVENKSKNYSVEFTWGTKNNYSDYCKATVKRGKMGGCLSSTSKAPKFHDRVFRFRRPSLSWTRKDPETAHPLGAFWDRPEINDEDREFESLFRYVALGGESEAVKQLDFLRSRGNFFTSDKSIDLEKLIRNQSILREYITKFNRLVLYNWITTALPISPQFRSRFSDPHYHERDNDFMMVYVGVISALTLSSGDLIASTRTYFQPVEDQQPEMGMRSLDSYPRYIHVLQNNGAVAFVGRIVPSVKAQSSEVAALVGKIFKLSYGRIMITDSSTQPSSPKDPSVLAAGRMTFFFPR